MPRRKKSKVVPGPENVVIETAARLYELARELNAPELKTLAGKLETSNSHLLEDIYDQCCYSIDPFVHAGILPASVVESVQQMIEDLQKKHGQKKTR